MNGRRVLDLPLLLLSLILTVTPLALSGATYSVESIKYTVFQAGTAYLLLVLAVRRGASFGHAKGLDLAVMAYVCANFLSFSRAEIRATGLPQLEILTYQVLFYVLVRSRPIDSDRFRWISTCWLAAAVAASAVAIVQVLGQYDVRFGVPWDTRATGPFIQPTFLGAYLSITLPIALARMLRSRTVGEQALLGLVLAVIGVALGLSLSRSGWLGAMAGLVTLAMLERKSEAMQNALVPLVVGGFIAIWVMLLWRPPTDLDLARLSPFGSRSNQERISMWRGSLRMSKKHPFVGYGPGNFITYFPVYAPPFLQRILANESQRPAHAHSEPFHILVETGAIGLLTWLLMIGWTWRSLLKAGDSRDSDESSLARVHLAMFAALLANAVVGLDQRFPTSAMIFWYILGVAATRVRGGRKASSAVVEADQGGGGAGVVLARPDEGEPRLGSVSTEGSAALAERSPVIAPPPPTSPGPSNRKRLALTVIAVYLIWLPIRNLKAEHAKMLGASFQYARQPEIAKEYLAMVTELHPYDAEAFFLTGRNFTIMGEYGKAEQAYLKALRLDPYSPTLLYNLAKVYTRSGSIPQAKKLLWKALEINPQYQIVAEELMRLENLNRAL